MMTLSKLCPLALPPLALPPLALPLLALLAASGAALAQPFPIAPRISQILATELAQPAVEKPSLAKSGQGDDAAWFYFGDDDGDDEYGDVGGKGDDDEGASRAQGSCALMLDAKGLPAAKATADCTTRNGQSANPPQNGLFTPGTAPVVKSN